MTSVPSQQLAKPMTSEVNWFSQVGERYSLAKKELVDKTAVIAFTSSKFIVLHSERMREVKIDNLTAKLAMYESVPIIQIDGKDKAGRSFQLNVPLNIASVPEHKRYLPDEDEVIQFEIHIWNPTTAVLTGVVSCLPDSNFSSSIFDAVKPQLNQHYNTDKWYDDLAQFTKYPLDFIEHQILAESALSIMKDSPLSNEPLTFEEVIQPF